MFDFPTFIFKNQPNVVRYTDILYMDPLGYKLNAQVTETTILDVKMMI